MNKTRSDEELMQEYRDGDTGVFEVLYGRFKGPLYRYFLRQCRVPAVAEELFQDVWLNLIRAREQYEVRAKFATYLFHLAHNRLIDYYRRQASGLPVSYADDASFEDVPDSKQVAAETQLDLKRQAARLKQLIGELPEAQREAFLLREETGLSVSDIAGVTGVNAETAKSRLRYAVARLKRGLSGKDGKQS
jgi:RNA polymerase sigma-70 factor (ECF subfamily)